MPPKTRVDDPSKFVAGLLKETRETIAGHLGAMSDADDMAAAHEGDRKVVASYRGYVTTASRTENLLRGKSGHMCSANDWAIAMDRLRTMWLDGTSFQEVLSWGLEEEHPAIQAEVAWLLGYAEKPAWPDVSRVAFMGTTVRV